MSDEAQKHTASPLDPREISPHWTPGKLKLETLMSSLIPPSAQRVAGRHLFPEADLLQLQKMRPQKDGWAVAEGCGEWHKNPKHWAPGWLVKRQPSA